MYCKDCNYFEIVQEPLPEHYDAGIAVCKLYNLETPFYHKGKFKRLKCIKETTATMTDKDNCNTCIHYKPDNPYCECCFDLDKYEKEAKNES